MTKEIYIHDKEDIILFQKRPKSMTKDMKRPAYMKNETYMYMPKETYIYDKRDLHI